MTQSTRQALTVRLPDELNEALRNYVFVTDTSANEVIKSALAEYLTAHAHTDVVEAAFCLMPSFLYFGASVVVACVVFPSLLRFRFETPRANR